MVFLISLSPCKNILLEIFGFETFLSIPEICGLNDKRCKLCFLLKERIKHYILCWNDDMKFTDQLGRHTFTTNVNLRLKISQIRRLVDKNWPNNPILYNRRKKEFLFVVDIKNSSQRVKENLHWSRDEHRKGDSAFSHDVTAASLEHWNGGHVCVSNQYCGSWTLFLCKRFLLLQLICIAAGHVSENALFTTGLQKYKLLHWLLLGLTEIFMFFSFDLFPWPLLGFHAI